MSNAINTYEAAKIRGGLDIGDYGPLAEYLLAESWKLRDTIAGVLEREYDPIGGAKILCVLVQERARVLRELEA